MPPSRTVTFSVPWVKSTVSPSTTFFTCQVVSAGGGVDVGVGAGVDAEGGTGAGSVLFDKPAAIPRPPASQTTPAVAPAAAISQFGNGGCPGVRLIKTGLSSWKVRF